MSPRYDAVIVGSGPNGLAAGIVLARAGLSVLVREGAETIGGGCRSAALTRSGFVHDVCSSVYPMGVASPFLRELPLAEQGLNWCHPAIPLAHLLEGGTAVALYRSVEETAQQLGPDANAYRRLMTPLVRNADILIRELVGPPRLPRHLFAALRFGLPALRSGRGLAEAYFRTEPARALLAGLAAHSVLPLEARPSAAIGLMLGLVGHAHGWPVVRGGAQRLVEAMAAYLRTLGGTIATGCWVRSWADLPPARVVLFDTSPRQLLAIAGNRLDAGCRRQLTRYRHGPGVFKVDWALSGPIPWTASVCRQAATVHVGGTLDAISVAEAAAFGGRSPESPFVLVTQPSICDPSRAPVGQQTAWGYCHVPHGSDEDMTERIESQIERYAPGFRDIILARSFMNGSGMERYNPNYIGGDIVGGIADVRQVFARPLVSLHPYRMGRSGLYLCSASTPPGAGVHGLCGYFAAQTALRDLRAG
ncbi:MAG: NAD(P)/FAD-dependent oxidoreductase [Bacteroidales bacterium]|nr:NAD(P)/FAD-dependent oxidoreductase [Bacteroidales bacterium]